MLTDAQRWAMHPKRTGECRVAPAWTLRLIAVRFNACAPTLANAAFVFAGLRDAPASRATSDLQTMPSSRWRAA